MISIDNLERYYEHGATKTWVLRRAKINLEEGEFVSIMGPSGAGKSTLLHILGMHDNAWLGEYFFFDQAVHKLKPKERVELRNKNIGFVFQSYHLLDNLTVYEKPRNSALVSGLQKIRTRSHCRGCPGSLWHRWQKRFISRAAFRRSATTDWRSPRHRGQPQINFGG